MAKSTSNWHWSGIYTTYILYFLSLGYKKRDAGKMRQTLGKSYKFYDWKGGGASENVKKEESIFTQTVRRNLWLNYSLSAQLSLKFQYRVWSTMGVSNVCVCVCVYLNASVIVWCCCCCCVGSKDCSLFDFFICGTTKRLKIKEMKKKIINVQAEAKR